MHFLRTFCFSLVLVLSSVGNADMRALSSEKYQQVGQHQSKWKAAIMSNNLKQIMSAYSDDVIFMPEYQPTLNGKEQVKEYYRELSQRRKVGQLTMRPDERFEIGDYIFDIGRFDITIDWKKDWKKQKEQLSGKYWQTWKARENGGFAIVTEAFGFNQRYDNATRWVTRPETRKDPSPTGFKPSQASLELKAYRAIGARGVMQKDGELRAQLYADDAVFYPYANTPKRGIDVLRPYLIKYSSHDAEMDWLQTHTHDVMYLGDYIYELTKFAVGWTYDGKPDQSNGKGMRIWKRQEDGQIRIYRHFGTHNHSP